MAGVSLLLAVCASLASADNAELDAGRFKAGAVPAPPAKWFDLRIPEDVKKRGGSVPAMRTALTVTNALPKQPKDMWLRYHMMYSGDGTIVFRREEIVVQNKLAWPDDKNGLGLRMIFSTKRDVDGFIQALKKAEEWSEVARANNRAEVVKEIGRSTRHIFSFIVKSGAPILRIHKITDSLDSYRVDGDEPSFETSRGGVRSVDLPATEWKVYESLLSFVPSMQAQMAKESTEIFK